MKGLEQLEREANDDFHLLDAVGAREFSTRHLLEMLDESRLRLEQFDRAQRTNQWLMAVAAGWVLATGAGFALNLRWLLILSCVGLTLAVLGVLAGTVTLVVRFKSRGELEDNLRQIEEELWRRA